MKTNKFFNKGNKIFLCKYIIISVIGYSIIFFGLYLFVDILNINEMISFMLIFAFHYVFLYTIQLKYLFKTNAKAECLNETDGFVKMIVDENGILVGCHIIGAHASDMIHEVTTIMNTNITIKDYKNIIHAHPTISEVIGECIKGFH